MLIINGALHFFPDDTGIYAVVREFVDALAPRSLVALQCATGDAITREAAEAVARAQHANGFGFQLRTRAEFARFFEGLEFVEPGISLMAEWRPDDSMTPYTPEQASAWAAVAHRP